MTILIERVIKIIVRYHVAFLAGTLLLTALLFFLFIRVEIGSSLIGLMPSKGQAERDFLERIQEELGSDYFLIIAITHDDIFTVPTLNKIQTLTSRIGEHPVVDRVLSLSTATITKSKGDNLYVQNILNKTPTTMHEIAQFREDVLDNPIYSGNLVTEDGKTTLVSVFFNKDHSEDVLRETIDWVQSQALSEVGPEEIHIHGLPAVTSSIYKMLISDLSTYIPLTIIIVSIILFINFRNWWCVLISLFFISISVVWTYASMALLKIPIYILTAFIPLVIAALGVSYGVYMFTEYLRQEAIDGNSRKTVGHTIRNILLAIWLSIITTATGFASLSLVNVVSIRELSVFLVIGTVTLLFLITFFVPSLLIHIHPRLQADTIAEEPLPKRASSRFIDLIIKYRHPIMIIAALFVLPSIFGALRLKVDTDLNQIFKPGAAISQATKAITKRLRGTTGISVIVGAVNEGELENPAFLKKIESLQSFLENLASVGKTTSVVDYLKGINKAFHDNRSSYHILPKSRAEVSQYLLMYSLADPLKMMDRYIDYTRRIGRISFRSSYTGSASLMKLKRLIEDRCSELFPENATCRVTSDSLLIASTSQIVSRGILLSFGLAASAISIIMFVLFRSFKIGILAMIPNLLPLLSILALMGWVGIDFNLGTSIIVCVAIGIAVDDTIHFLVRYFHELKLTNHYLIRRQTNLKITADQIKALKITFSRVKRPVILTSVAIFCGFSALALSQFVPIILFGTLTALTMVFCLLYDLILLPAMLASTSI